MRVRRRQTAGSTCLFVVQDETQFPNKLIRVRRVFKRDKPKTFGAARLPVHHDRGVDDFTKRGEELPHRVRAGGRRKTADEITCVPQVLFPWNGTFGVDLLGYNKINMGRTKTTRASNRFAVKNVIAGKDSVDGLCVLKREERKAP